MLQFRVGKVYFKKIGSRYGMYQEKITEMGIQTNEGPKITTISERFLLSRNTATSRDGMKIRGPPLPELMVPLVMFTSDGSAGGGSGVDPLG